MIVSTPVHFENLHLRVDKLAVVEDNWADYVGLAVDNADEHIDQEQEYLLGEFCKELQEDARRDEEERLSPFSTNATPPAPRLVNVELHPGPGADDTFDPLTCPVDSRKDVLLGVAVYETVIVWLHLSYDDDSNCCVKVAWPAGRLRSSSTTSYTIRRGTSPVKEPWLDELDTLVMEKVLRRSDIDKPEEYDDACHIMTFASVGFRHEFKRLRGRRVVSVHARGSYGGYPAMSLPGEEVVILASTGSECSDLGYSTAAYNAIVDRLLGLTIQQRW